MSGRIHQTKKRFECACLAFIQVLLFKVLTLCHSPQTAGCMLVLNMLSCSHELPQKFILFLVHALCPFIFSPNNPLCLLTSLDLSLTGLPTSVQVSLVMAGCLSHCLCIDPTGRLATLTTAPNLPHQQVS